MPSTAIDLRKEVNGAVEAAPLYLLHVAANDGALTSHTRIVAA